MPPSDPAFIVEELSGERRRIELTGYCLPLAKRGTTWRGRQRVARHWYPGSPDATIQVLGPEELPSSFHFAWNLRRMAPVGGAGLFGGGSYATQSTTPGIVSIALFDQSFSEPMELAEAFDSIRRGGQEVEVVWGALVRRGVLSLVEQKPENEDRVECSLTFEWGSRGDFVAAALIRTFDFSEPAATFLQLLTQWADVLAKPARFAQEALDDFNSQILQMESALTTYSGIIDEYTDLADAGRATIQNVIGLAGTLREAAVALEAELELDPASASTADDMAQVTLAEGVVYGGQDLARQMKEQADLIRREALALFGGDDLLTVEVAPDGATLQQYAAAYYGDASKWPVIAQYNELSEAWLTAGDLVAIPRLDALAVQ